MKRRISWLAAMRDVRADRDARPAIREERLRTTAGLRGNPAVAMSAWRGLSGRRHIVTVYDFDMDAPAHVAGGVAIAVRRDAVGLAHVVAIGGDSLRPSWWAQARAAGATELHVHRLAADAGERAMLMMDLTADE